MEYLIHILIMTAIYVTLACGLNLIAGYAGILSVAHAAFFGIGAYAAALMALHTQLPFLFNLACSVMLCGLAGGIVGAPSLRIRDDYFVIATFAFQIILFSLLNNLGNLTGGPMGLPGIPPPHLFGWEINSSGGFLILSLASAAFAFLMCQRTITSPVGRVLSGIRENVRAIESFGKNPVAFKISAFILGSSLAALAGGVYAHYISFIDPTSFTVMESIFIISIVIIGGAGSLWGPVLGAVVLVSLPELLRFVGMPSSVAANMRQILYGAALVGCMMWRPQGLIGEFSFRRSEKS